MEDSIARKLAVPKKLSAWEREKQAAEAKKQRQEAENAAALRDFQKSLGVDGAYDEDDFPPVSRRDRDRDQRAPYGQTRPDRSHPASRHGAGVPRGPSKPKSGPGSLGPVDGFEQPPNLKRKRALEEARMQAPRYEEVKLSRPGRDDRSYEQARNANPDAYEPPRPAVYLQALPPNVTIEEVKALVSPYLKMHTIRFTDRHRSEPIKNSLFAIITLAYDMHVGHIENAMKHLNNKYLRCGFRVKMLQYSGESLFDAEIVNGIKFNAPFSAYMAGTPANSFSMRNAPPPTEHYGSRARHNDRRSQFSRRQDLEVKVKLPLDISTVQAVHTIADRLLSEPNIDRALELEALFMQQPEVQYDERFAFLFDSKSPAGIYYRYCLWSRDIVEEDRRKVDISERIYTDTDMIWKFLAQEATFPNLTQLSQVVTDIDYVSSEDESDNEDVRKKAPDRPEPETLLVETERNFLLPLQHARLTHLLARLPTVNTRLRRGDVARITNFAINHAGIGAEQIVDKILLNVVMPFATTAAAEHEAADHAASDHHSDEAEYEPEDPAVVPGEGDKPTADDDTRQNDPSGAKLVALYVISDILSASATAGARNAWKYRQLFEAGFKRQRTFEKLGSIDRELGWGRMKMDHWKRKVAAIFDIWESWSVFSSEAMQSFRKTFNQDPEDEPAQVDQPATADVESNKPKWMTKMKVIDKDATKYVRLGRVGKNRLYEDVEGHETNNDDATEEDKPNEELVDGPEKVGSQALQSNQPLPPSSNEMLDHVSSTSKPAQALNVSTKASANPLSAVPTPAPKRRMRAEDMFADSDEEGI